MTDSPADDDAARWLTPGVPRYELTAIDGAGLLLELDSGQIVTLNRTAFLIWNRYLAGASKDEVASFLAGEYAMPPAAALRDVNLALTIPKEYSRFPDQGLRYQVDRQGRCIAVASEGPVLELGRAGDHVIILQAFRPPILESYLCAAVPKLLTLAGETVFHASAVRVGSETIAFLGASGAGKTTTAAAFGSLGHQVVAEDMLLLREQPNGAFVPLRAEAAAKAWAAQAALRLAESPGAQVAFVPPPSEPHAPFAPLTKVNFLDRAQRRGSTVARRSLARAETAGRLFANTFASSIEPAARRSLLSKVVAVATCVSGYELTMPEGLENLSRAAAAGHGFID